MTLGSLRYFSPSRLCKRASRRIGMSATPWHPDLAHLRICARHSHNLDLFGVDSVAANNNDPSSSCNNRTLLFRRTYGEPFGTEYTLTTAGSTCLHPRPFSLSLHSMS